MLSKGETDRCKPTPYEAGAIDTVRVILLDHITSFFGDDLDLELYRQAKEHVEAFVRSCERFIKAMWLRNGEKLRKQALAVTQQGRTFEYRDLPSFPDVDEHLSKIFLALDILVDAEHENEFDGTDDGDPVDEVEEHVEPYNEASPLFAAEEESGMVESFKRELGARLYAMSYRRSKN